MLSHFSGRNERNNKTLGFALLYAAARTLNFNNVSSLKFGILNILDKNVAGPYILRLLKRCRWAYLVACRFLLFDRVARGGYRQRLQYV